MDDSDDSDEDTDEDEKRYRVDQRRGTGVEWYIPQLQHKISLSPMSQKCDLDKTQSVWPSRF